MTAEQNIIAAAIQVLWAAELCNDCLAEFDDPSACHEWAEAQDDFIDKLGVAVETAGIDWRDPVVRERFRKGQGFS